MGDCYAAGVTTTTTAQTLPLEDVVPGITYLLVITSSPGSNTLKFKHLNDATSANHPAHTDVSNATVVTQFVCPSTVMALVFAAAPATPYHVTVVPLTAPEF